MGRKRHSDEDILKLLLWAVEVEMALEYLEERLSKEKGA